MVVLFILIFWKVYVSVAIELGLWDLENLFLWSILLIDFLWVKSLKRNKYRYLLCLETGWNSITT